MIREMGGTTGEYVFGHGIDEPLSQSRGGSISYYAIDGLGSTIGLYDTAGLIQNTYTYDAWGLIRNQTGATLNAFGYTSREFGEVGLYFYRMLTADLLQLFRARNHRASTVELACQILIIVFISTFRLGLRAPISGHSLLASFLITRRLSSDRGLNEIEKGETICTFAILAMLTYVKLVWWNDPITLFAGCVVGFILVIVGRIVIIFKQMRVRSLLILLIPGLFLAGCSKPSVQNEKKQEAAAPKLDDDLQRKQFHDEVAGYVENENFVKLEEIAKEVNTKQLRFPGGDWKLERFYQNVLTPDQAHPEKTDWKRLLEKLEKWNSQYPDSIYANVALADGQISQGWALRGGSFSNTVNDKQFAEFTEWLHRAEKTLNQKVEKKKECIAWFSQMQEIGIGLSWDRDKMLKLTEEAISVNPLYWDVYESYARYLLPRWYGAPGEWEQFMEQASAKLPIDEGHILYSELCWEMSRYYQPTEFFQKNRVSYKRMKYGFIAREKKYGASIRYLNAFALMAGGASDKVTTRVLLKRIGERWEPAFWQDRKYFDGFKKWANE